MKKSRLHDNHFSDVNPRRFCHAIGRVDFCTYEFCGIRYYISEFKQPCFIRIFVHLDDWRASVRHATGMDDSKTSRIECFLTCPYPFEPSLVRHERETFSMMINHL